VATAKKQASEGGPSLDAMAEHSEAARSAIV